MERPKETEGLVQGSLLKRFRNKLGLLLMVAMAGCSDCSDEVLHRVCPEECYTGEGRAGVGQCNTGTPICDEDMNVIECEGQGSPSEEVCDNVDNDCDGQTDESLQFETRCKVYGECRGAIQRCLNGVEVCDYPGQTEFPDERSCDGLDNDCDGRTDENTIPDEFCFDDEFWKATNGICRPGIKACLAGRVVCEGQVLPEKEICDGIDQDCNGIVDDADGEIPSTYDIVLSLDSSASMCGEMESVLAALDAYAKQYEGDTNYRFAIVLMTGNPLVQVIEDFNDINVIRDRLQTMTCNGGGLEASLDVLLSTCEHNQGSIGLSWRNGANALVFSFTDEPPQTYTNPPTTGEKITDTCLENGVLPIQWSRDPAQFAPIVEGANGIHFEVVDDFQKLLADLNSINIVSCNRRTGG